MFRSTIHIARHILDALVVAQILTYAPIVSGYLLVFSLFLSKSKNQAEVSGLQISDSTCADYIKNVSCSKCDPWGAHLFGSEATINTSVDPSVFAMPSLCRPYCEQFYAACADVRMNFQPGQSPWSASKMRDTYQTVDAFCNRFSVQSTDTSCFRFDPLHLLAGC